MWKAEALGLQNGHSFSSPVRRLQAFFYLFEKELVPLKEQLFPWVQKTFRTQVTMKPAYLPPGPSIEAIWSLPQAAGSVGPSSPALEGASLQVRCLLCSGPEKAWVHPLPALVC